MLLILSVFVCALQTVNLSPAVQRRCVPVALINCTTILNLAMTVLIERNQALSMAVVVHGTRLDRGCVLHYLRIRNHDSSLP